MKSSLCYLKRWFRDSESQSAIKEGAEHEEYIGASEQAASILRLFQWANIMIADTLAMHHISKTTLVRQDGSYTKWKQKLSLFMIIWFMLLHSQWTVTFCAGLIEVVLSISNHEVSPHRCLILYSCRRALFRYLNLYRTRGNACSRLLGFQLLLGLSIYVFARRAILSSTLAPFCP